MSRYHSATDAKRVETIKTEKWTIKEIEGGEKERERERERERREKRVVRPLKLIALISSRRSYVERAKGSLSMRHVTTFANAFTRPKHYTRPLSLKLGNCRYRLTRIMIPLTAAAPLTRDIIC